MRRGLGLDVGPAAGVARQARGGEAGTGLPKTGGWAFGATAPRLDDEIGASGWVGAVVWGGGGGA